MEYKKEEELKSDLEFNKLVDPDREPAIKTQIIITVS